MQKKWTIQQVKSYLLEEIPSPEVWKQLSLDERAGVQTLLKQYKKRKEKEQELEQQFARMSQWENKQWHDGIQYIAGVDEVGRGPLAGPVVAAAVILPSHFKLLGLDDSKKLTKKKREYFYNELKIYAIDYGIGIVSAKEIDQINILQAAKKAMYKALHNLSQPPEHVLIDAVPLNELTVPSESIIKGDQQSNSIAAASIMAKVTRDNMMRELHEMYPTYAFHKNNGYGTKDHLEAIKLHGLTPYHRKTFVKSH